MIHSAHQELFRKKASQSGAFLLEATRAYNEGMPMRKTVSELLNSIEIQQLALPSNLRYGTAIYERGAVEFIKNTPEEIEAWVGGLAGNMAEGGGSRRRTQLFATDEGLTWHCAGNPKNHQIFCKHCVALAFAIVNKRDESTG